MILYFFANSCKWAQHRTGFSLFFHCNFKLILGERGLNDCTAQLTRQWRERLCQKSMGSGDQAPARVYSHSWNKYLSSWLHCHSLVNAPDFLISLVFYLTSYHLEPGDVKPSICCCFLHNGNVNSSFELPIEALKNDWACPDDSDNWS